MKYDSQTIICTLERCARVKGERSGNNVGAIIVVIFTIAEISYLVVGLFNSL